MGRLKAFFSVCSFVLFPLHVLSQQDHMAQKLETYLNLIHSSKRFSGEILVADPTNILFSKAIGFSSVENNTRLEPGARYRIASISKTFTGTLIAMAESERKLDLRDKAVKYIPELSPKFRDITIEQLLTHRSGLPHNEGIKDYWKIKSRLDMTTGQVIEEINLLDLLFEPGSAEQYSSLGYYLLATILESVYKENFAGILQHKLLDSLQMQETGSAYTLEIIKQMTSGYHLVTDNHLVVAPYRNYSMLKGAGDMYSSATDLWKWNKNFLPAHFPAINSDSINSRTGGYHYGWKLSTQQPVKYYHGGGTWGYSTYTAFYPTEKISIILLANVSTIPVSDIASDIEKIVFGRPFEMPLTGQEVLSEGIDLQPYCGRYSPTGGGAALTISRSGQSLYARLTGKPAFQIYPKGNHIFYGKKVDVEITFEQENGAVSGLKAVTKDAGFHFKKEDQ